MIGRERGLAIAAQLLRQLKAVHAGHHHVDQHQVGPKAARLADRALAAVGLPGQVALRLEHVAADHANARIVVDEEDLLASHPALGE